MDESTGTMSAAANQRSADADELILVDEGDREVGQLRKDLCHRGGGVLHRAVSLLIFNGSGDTLVQQRAASKRLWPLYWSNSVCSHPRHAESMERATSRRLHEELGVNCALHFLFKFQYQAQFDETGAEHELCSVFIGRCTDPIRVNHDEISCWKWISPEALQAQMSDRNAEQFTPWFKLEWARIWGSHRAALHALQTGSLNS